MNPPPPYDTPDDPADEFQGDTQAADIVGPTGEEMPIATHAEVHRTPEPPAYDAQSSRGDQRD